MWPLTFSNPNPALWLILARCSSFFILSPLFQRLPLPLYLRSALAVLLALLLLPTLPLIPSVHLSQLVTQSLIGFLMGLMISMLFEAALFAGQLLALFAGLQSDTIFDPSPEGPRPLLGQFFILALFILLLATESHHLIIKMLTHPSLLLHDPSLSTLIALSNAFGNIFLWGAQLVMPPLCFLALFYVMLALITKMWPHWQAYWIALPLQIFIGLFALALTLPSIYSPFMRFLTQTLDSARDVFFPF